MLTAAPNYERSNQEFQIGGKIHFEEESGTDYLGTREINRITRNTLHTLLNITSDSCAPNSKVLLTTENDKIKISHYEEKNRPGIGEDIHATLLYTKPRGFCDSETLEQIYCDLFEMHESAPTVERVANTYSKIIKPEWRFQISEVILTENGTNSFIIAELLFENRKNIYKNDKPISSGLHLTLANCNDSTILANKDISNPLIQALNKELKGKMVKIATKNGVADLEFGLSGSSWRMRAEERVEKLRGQALGYQNYLKKKLPIISIRP
jgi:hypothetical protein